MCYVCLFNALINVHYIERVLPIKQSAKKLKELQGETIRKIAARVTAPDKIALDVAFLINKHSNRWACVFLLS